MGPKEAALHQAIDAADREQLSPMGWSRKKDSLDAVEEALRQAANTNIQGETGDSMRAAFTQAADEEGHQGDVRWNFEKFLVSADGQVVARFGPLVTPEDDKLVAAIESQLPATTG